MQVVLRAMLVSVTAILGGCAWLAGNECHYDARHAGENLGLSYTGTTCTTTTSKTTHNGKPEVTTMTDCKPNYVESWRWNGNSDRYYAKCMAEVDRKYGPQPRRAGD